jgi:hypothetical protein
MENRPKNHGSGPILLTLSPTRPNLFVSDSPTPRSEAAQHPLPLRLRAREDEIRQEATRERPRTMMACRRLARDAVAASLRRSAATETTASTPAFFSSSSAAASSCSSGAPVAGSPIRHFLARYSSPAFQIQPSAAGLGPSFAARVALGLRPQLSGYPYDRAPCLSHSTLVVCHLLSIMNLGGHYVVYLRIQQITLLI